MPQLHLTQKQLDDCLFHACSAKHLTYAMVALAAGADVNARRFNHVTPLHVVTLRRNVEIAALLIDQGADLHAQDIKGRTPLDLASSCGYPDIAALLNKAARLQQKHGSRVTTRRDGGEPPVGG